MSGAIQRRWKGRPGGMAGVVLRLCVALLLVLQIVYAPIHLYREPHSNEADISGAPPFAPAAGFVSTEDEDADSHHERHSASQHKLQVLRSQRVPVAEMVLVPMVALVVAEQEGPHPQVFEFSGLSPPELLRSWQFYFRAALPVRAPSLLS
jgi:hypothetical protein